MSREQDALFAEKVVGWTRVYPEKGAEEGLYSIYYGIPPLKDRSYPYGNVIPFFSSDPNCILAMMAAIEKLCGALSSVVLHRENGAHTAIARWFDNKWHEPYRDGDGTANGALLALGLAVADEVQNMHGEEAL